MLPYTLKLLLLLAISLALAWLLNAEQMRIEKRLAIQQDNWEYCNSMYHQIKYHELVGCGKGK